MRETGQEDQQQGLLYLLHLSKSKKQAVDGEDVVVAQCAGVIAVNEKETQVIAVEKTMTATTDVV